MAIGGLFTGKVRLTDQNPPESFRLVVEGTGKIGFLKGEGLLHPSICLESAETHTEASVQRLLDAISKMKMKKFFEKLAEAAVE